MRILGQSSITSICNICVCVCVCVCDLRKKNFYNNQDKDLSNIFSKWTHYKHAQNYSYNPRFQ